MKGDVTIMFCDCGYHESDLSWLIKLIKQALDEWKNVQNEWKDMQEWITNYFENLDIPTEIKKIIEGMIEDGSFQQIVQNMLSHFVHVKYYGAKGDGVTDDTAAIQACIDANPNCEIFFDKGSQYRITQSIKPYCQYGAQILNLNGSRIFIDKASVGVNYVIYYKDKNLEGFPADKLGSPTLTGGILDGSNVCSHIIYAETYFPIFSKLSIKNFTVGGICLGAWDGSNHISQRATLEDLQITQDTTDSLLSTTGVVLNNPDNILKNVVVLGTRIGFRINDEGQLLEQCHFWPQFREKPIPNDRKYATIAVYLSYYENGTFDRYFRTLIKDFYFDECTICIYADGHAWWSIDVNGFWLASGAENNNEWTQYFFRGYRCVFNAILNFPYSNRNCKPFNRLDSSSVDLLYEYENSTLKIVPLQQSGITGEYENIYNIMNYVGRDSTRIALDNRAQLENGKYYYLGLIVTPRSWDNYLYRVKIGHDKYCLAEIIFRNSTGTQFEAIVINRIIQNNDYSVCVFPSGIEDKYILQVAVKMKVSTYNNIWCILDTMQPDSESYVVQGPHIIAPTQAWLEIDLQTE